MAINLTANYSKKLGLPGYSSHSFSASVEVEVSSAADIPQEIARLYATLQQNVDKQIHDPGFIPPGDYGMETSRSRPAANPGKPTNVVSMQQGGWQCSPKQREFIERITAERRIDSFEVEELTMERFGKPLASLDKQEASSFIDLVFELYPLPRKKTNTGKGAAR